MWHIAPRLLFNMSVSGCQVIQSVNGTKTRRERYFLPDFSIWDDLITRIVASDYGVRGGCVW
jgi:hypothetical protein